MFLVNILGNELSQVMQVSVVEHPRKGKHQLISFKTAHKNDVNRSQMNSSFQWVESALDLQNRNQYLAGKVVILQWGDFQLICLINNLGIFP